jgi:hypothetical protein
LLMTLNYWILRVTVYEMTLSLWAYFTSERSNYIRRKPKLIFSARKYHWTSDQNLAWVE